MFETSLLFNTTGVGEPPPSTPSFFTRLKRFWLPGVIISGIASVAIGILLYNWPLLSLPAGDEAEVILDLDEQTSNATIYVYISGAVEHPGVYPVTEGDRVATLIDAAGGVSSTADKRYLNSQLNLSQRLKDEQKIHIPFEGETANSSDETQQNISIKSEYTASPNLISLNTASESELDSLPGIGPATAQKIISARPFLEIAELTKKKIVSQSVYDEIESALSL